MVFFMIRDSRRRIDVCHAGARINPEHCTSTAPPVEILDRDEAEIVGIEKIYPSPGFD